MKTNILPLMMGDRVIGMVTLDYETGKLDGKLDPELVGFLKEGFEQGLMEVSFFGKPVVPTDTRVIQKKLYDFINRQVEVEVDQVILSADQAFYYQKEEK